MNEESSLKIPKREFRRRGKQIICIFIDAVYLCLWAVIQFLVRLLIERLELSGIDRWILLTFQAVFAVSTIVPIAIYIYMDIKIMIFKAVRQIEQELELNKSAD